MPSASVNALPHPPTMSQVETTPTSFSLRDFVVDEDAANFTASLWKSIDQTAFVLAQRDALEAYNVAKAMRLSEETAAQENHRRASLAASSSGSSSASASAAAAAAAMNTTTTIIITPPTQPRSSSASEFAKQKSPSPPISHHDRRPSSSASAQALAARTSVQPRLSLSTTSSTVNSLSSTSASQYYQRSISKHEPESSAKFPASIPSQSSSSSSASSAPQVSSSASSAPHVSSSASPPQPSSSASTPHTQPSDHKRRRTERQPSISSNIPSFQQQQQLVVPPIIDSKNSTASVRLINPPPTPVEPRSRRRSTVKSPTISKLPVGPRDLFMATRNCTKCGTLVPSPRSQSTTDAVNDVIPLLHVTCTKCYTMHCRGCFAVARCNRALVLASSISTSQSASPRSPTSTSPNECSGGSTCTVRNCCAAVRAIAIFEALSAFDDAFAAEAGLSAEDLKGKGKSRDHRDAYVRQLVGGVSKNGDKDKDRAQGSGARRFEEAFVRTLKTVGDWLQAPEAEDAEDGYPLKNKGKDLHLSIPRLFASSLLLEVVCAFLGNTTVRDWVTHAETYLVILDFLRGMFNASTLDMQSQLTGRNASAMPWLDALTLKNILRAPLRRIETTCGLRSAVWGDGRVFFEDVASAEQAPAVSERKSLCDLIRNLEDYRRQLQACATLVTFKPTLDKVSNLCDKIMYLLLMQVVEI